MRVEATEDHLNWVNGLGDSVGRARIEARVDRLAHGNPGVHRVLSGGVRELKIDFWPGYRVYYAERIGVLIILLAGGDESTQRADIAKALSLARQL